MRIEPDRPRRYRRRLLDGAEQLLGRNRIRGGEPLLMIAVASRAGRGRKVPGRVKVKAKATPSISLGTNLLIS